jgi:HTH-type transcriptional regulator / antitoxin HipB
MKTYTLDELQDKFIGPVGTPARDKFERELGIDLIGSAIRQVRKDHHLTQEDLGSLPAFRRHKFRRLKTEPGAQKLIRFCVYFPH